MKRMKWFSSGLLAVALTLLSVFPPFISAAAEATELLYQNNFEQIQVGTKLEEITVPSWSGVGKAPNEFLVLDGNFTIQQEGGNKFAELPGAPLDTYGALFGPTAKTNLSVSARVFSTAKGRRFPTFGVGLFGQSGYKLQVSPAKKMLELYRGEELLTSVAFEWKSGQWTMLSLQAVKDGETWKVEGKAWTQGETEPSAAMLVFQDKTEPNAGRAAIWGSPFATTPIWYDDLVVKKVVP